jgi:hypothetical protein
MITVADEQFRREVEKFKLRCTCEVCGAFDLEATTCVYGFPTEPHRRLPLANDRPEFVFCKSFELA